MIDNDMTNILKNFSGAEKGAGTVVDAKTGKTKVSTAAAEKNAMKSLLEGLDAQQKSVNQMPAQHKMGSGYGKKHPASKFMVGEAEKPWEKDAEVIGDEDWDDKWMVGDRQSNAPEIRPGVKVHVGHAVAGGAGIRGTVVSVKDGTVIIKNPEGNTYKGQLKNTTVLEAAVEEDTIAKREAPRKQMNKKQSLADVFRSMDETEEDVAARFKKELHTERTASKLNKGTNGKFDLAEEDDEPGWGDELIEDLKLLVAEVSELDGIIDTQMVLDLIEKYERT